MDFINSFLAKLLDSFKAKNPKLATIILLVLGTVIYWSENGLGELIGYDLSHIVQYVTIAIGFLTGSRTVSYLEENKKK